MNLTMLDTSAIEALRGSHVREIKALYLSHTGKVFYRCEGDAFYPRTIAFPLSKKPLTGDELAAWIKAERVRNLLGIVLAGFSEEFEEGLDPEALAAAEAIDDLLSEL